MDTVKQGPDFVHLAVQHILLLLYRALQDVLDRDPSLPEAVGISKQLLTAPGEAGILYISAL